MFYNSQNSTRFNSLSDVKYKYHFNWIHIGVLQFFLIISAFFVIVLLRNITRQMTPSRQTIGFLSAQV